MADLGNKQISTNYQRLLQISESGGGTGVSFGGGGGAGGFREGRNNPITPYTASPLVTTGLTVTATSFPITVGAGGAAAIPSCGGANPAQDGSPSSFSTPTLNNKSS